MILARGPAASDPSKPLAASDPSLLAPPAANNPSGAPDFIHLYDITPPPFQPIVANRCICRNNSAKNMLMSTLAAVVFSFVFTTSANANPTQETTPQKGNLEVRVKGAQKGNVGVRVKGDQKDNVGIRVKGDQKDNVEIRVKDDPNQFESFIEDVLGIRVKIRVK